jgi:hypothetical protein
LKKEETPALIPEENVLMDTEKAWISVRQLSAGFGTMLTAGAQSGRKRPQEHGKTVVFKPATFHGFRNDADICRLCRAKAFSPCRRHRLESNCLKPLLT